MPNGIHLTKLTVVSHEPKEKVFCGQMHLSILQEQTG